MADIVKRSGHDFEGDMHKVAWTLIEVMCEFYKAFTDVWLTLALSAIRWMEANFWQLCTTTCSFSLAQTSCVNF